MWALGDHNLRRTAARWPWYIAVAACLSALASAWFDGVAGLALTLAWLVTLALCGLSLMWDRSRSLAVACVLLAFAWMGGLLCTGAVWSLLSPVHIPAEQGPLRLGFSLASLVVAAALRPLVPARAEAPHPALVASAALPAVLLPILSAAPLLLSSTPLPVLKVTSMAAEDSATWIAQSQAILRLGQAPSGGTESDYPRTAASFGWVFEILTSGRPAPAQLVVSSVDAVFASWMLCACALGLVALVVMVLLLPRRLGPLGGEPVPTTALASTAVQLTAWSLVLLLMAPQHLSLVWTGSAAAALVVISAAAGQARGFSPAACGALALVAAAASTSWPYGLVGLALSGAGLSIELWRRLGRRGLPAMACLMGGLGIGVLDRVAAMRLTGATAASYLGQLGASGLSLPVPPVLQAVLVAALGLAIMARVAPKWARVPVVALSTGLVLGAGLISATRPLPFGASAYAADKTIYLALLSLPLLLAVCCSWIIASAPRPVAWITLSALLLFLAVQQPTGAALAWGRAMHAESAKGTGQRLIAAAEAGVGFERTVCLPSDHQLPHQNYLCQRLMDAFSEHSDTTLRSLWLNPANGAATALQQARASNDLDGAVHLVDALWVMSGRQDPAFEPRCVELSVGRSLSNELVPPSRQCTR